MPISIGLDIGGTNISAVICDERGNILYSHTRKSDYYGDQYLRNIEEIIENTIKESNDDISGIGIGVPGTVDHNTGNIIVCPAFNWRNVQLKEHIESKFGISTFIDNDVNIWTLAEKYLGAAKDYDDFVMITIGTGIGCGLYIGGKLYRGHSFEAGEIGYLPLTIEAYNETFSENNFGFFETKASASAASRIYREITNKNIDCKEIFLQAKQGDKIAKKVVDDIYKYLGLGISSIFCILNPQIVVIGGGMAEEGTEFLNELTRKIKSLIPLDIKLSLTQTKKYGGAVGSALSIFYEMNSKGTVQTNVPI
ncbi:ROK family protein [Ruminiclostridium herbifermentans]|uniref:ROK family protein n=1 Tax=Ruminiclostridium herbifermentans TaxID=2488810 RepID=A0A4U7JIS1_9FIRM|nr:ROK family protein [Ruminiclostridium herbifermentans]QNU68664.1 ROK family protein [Ruminiclostridium herbifermentans]